MKLKITKEEQNPLFNRKEIQGTIESEASPNKQEVAKAIAEKYNVDSEALRVLYIKGKFGSKQFDLKANIYASKEERDKLENISKKESEAEAKANEKPAEEPAEETTPAEESAPAEEATPAEEAIGLNPVEEAKDAEAEKAEEDKKEKDKTEEEKQTE